MMSRHALLFLALVVTALAQDLALANLDVELDTLDDRSDFESCLEGTEDCHVTCSRNEEGYTCTCESGYEWDGRTCVMACVAPNFKVGSECFYLSQDKKTWFSAKYACEALGGALAEPSNPRQVEAKVKKTFKGPVFLGGNDLVEDGRWMGVSGRPFVIQGQWARGEPNNRGGNEDCLAFHPGKNIGLNDLTCQQSHRYLCEM